MSLADATAGLTELLQRVYADPGWYDVVNDQETGDGIVTPFWSVAPLSVAV